MSGEKKQIIFSGIQPTGFFTLGNYFGAIKNWVGLQEDYHCVYSIVDLHAITVKQDPSKLRQQILSSYALLMACGINIEKSILFIQSHVPAHSELAWILNCYAQFGEVSRMTQFKEKSQRNPDNVNVGLYAYPVLQAADILLYQSNLVPVGADQKQHLELARDIANRFNYHHGNVFTVPEVYIPKVGAKIMSLADPIKKMSKSDDNPKAYISILDPPQTIVKKFKSAVTDSETEIAYREGKDGINNLMSIYSIVTGKSYDHIEKIFAGKGYGDFKTAVGEAVADHLRPIQTEYDRLMKDKVYLESCYKVGAEKAGNFANRTLQKVQKKIGFIQK